MVSFCDHIDDRLHLPSCLLRPRCGEGWEAVWPALVMLRGADIARPPHEPLDTLECLILLGVASTSLRVTGVIYPRGPSLLCYAVADRALGTSVYDVNRIFEARRNCTSLKSTLILSMVWS